MLTVGNKISLTPPLGTKSCSGTATMSLKTTFQFLLTSNYSLDLRHQNHNLPPFFIFFQKPFFYVAERARKSREYNFGTMKNKKERSWPGSRPHETEVTTAAVCLELRSLSGCHRRCETRHLVAPMSSSLDHHGQNAR